MCPEVFHLNQSTIDTLAKEAFDLVDEQKEKEKGRDGLQRGPTHEIYVRHEEEGMSMRR